MRILESKKKEGYIYKGNAERGGGKEILTPKTPVNEKKKARK